MQPPDGEPGSDPGDPQATPPPPGADADTTRLPFEEPPATLRPTASAPAPCRRRARPGLPGSMPGASVLWASPTAPVSQEIPGAPGLSFADTPSRFVGYVLDSIIVSIIGSIIAAILGLGRGTVVTSGGTTSANYAVTGGAFLVPYVVVGFAYFVFFWTGGRRATPGQQLFKLQVGNAFDGMALTSHAGGQALVRAGHLPEPVLDPARDLPAGVARRARLGDRPVRDHGQEPNQAGLPRQVRQLGRGQAVRAVVERPAHDLPDHHPRPRRPVRRLDHRDHLPGQPAEHHPERRRDVDLILAVWASAGVTGPGARLRVHRGVAQSGSAPVWGTGGRRFKSGRPDQTFVARKGPGGFPSRPGPDRGLTAILTGFRLSGDRVFGGGSRGPTQRVSPEPGAVHASNGGKKEVSSATARASGLDWSLAVLQPASSAKRPVSGSGERFQELDREWTDATAIAAMQPRAARMSRRVSWCRRGDSDRSRVVRIIPGEVG